MARHFRPLGRVERIARKLHVETMKKLGVSPFVARAQGARFVVDTTDYIDACLALFGMWEEVQLEQLAELAIRHKADIFLDIGANAGFYSVMFAVKKLAPRIIAFEPDPGNYARLIANLDANGLIGRIETVQIALGDQASEVKLYEGGKWNRGESTIVVPEQTPQEVTFQVKQARLDELYAFKGQTIIIKMDVEGSEFHVLAGMERTLKENACYLQVEHYGTRHEELKAALARVGYRYLHTHDIDLFFTNMPGVG
jgi:FkbM family methyltransferase